MELNPIGFNNFNGAACWLNSMTQAILGSSHINKLIYEENDEKKLKENKLLSYYKKIVEFSNTKRGTAALHSVMNSLSNNAREAQELMRQNDPTEYIMKFLKNLHHNTIDLCVHTVCSTIICPDHRHIKKENNLLMSVSLNDINNLQNYLDKHTEEIECKCDKDTADRVNININNNPIKTRLMQLYYGPKVLIIMVKNYLYSNNTSQVIDYPLELKFKKLNNDYIVYNIKSVVEHYGNKSVNRLIAGQSSGHYICTSKRRDGIYRLNDNSTSKVREFSKTPNVCMLIYER